MAAADISPTIAPGLQLVLDAIEAPDPFGSQRLLLLRCGKALSAAKRAVAVLVPAQPIAGAEGIGHQVRRSTLQRTSWNAPMKKAGLSSSARPAPAPASAEAVGLFVVGEIIGGSEGEAIRANGVP